MLKNYIKRYSSIALLTVVLFLLFSCNTGIENTKTIRMSKSEMKSTRTTEEDLFMADLQAPLLNKWSRGKRFLVTDERAALVFEGINNLDSANLAGKIIEYLGVEEKINPAGKKEAVIVFQTGKNLLRFPTDKSFEDASTSVSSMDVPMIIDLDLVSNASDYLRGKKLWTRTRLWYDEEGAKLDGRQFVPVKIIDVYPGTMIFPLKLHLMDEEGNSFVLYMNLKKSGKESRTFASLFTLSDPKQKYTFVQPEHWQLIERGLVCNGMTKEECKLSIGLPSDVNSGHDWNSTIEFWQYPNGTFLRFEDGILIGFRN